VSAGGGGKCLDATDLDDLAASGHGGGGGDAATLHNRERIYDDSGAGCSTANSATVTSDRNTGTQQRRSADLLARDVLDIPKYRGIFDTIDGTSYYVV